LSVEKGTGAGPLLLETLRIEEGKPSHSPWHEERMNRSRRELFGVGEPLLLEEILTAPPATGIWRCRILYRERVERVEYLPYRERNFRRLAVAEFGGEYPYKYAERTPFDTLLHRYPEVDDLILCREGRLTDTTIANLALKIGSRWLTPETPLLPGTTRARLLAEGRIEEAPLSCEALREAEELALMNAMIGFRRLSGVEILIPAIADGTVRAESLYI
jgi:4-amino-4-deoxychorismate lyase